MKVRGATFADLSDEEICRELWIGRAVERTWRRLNGHELLPLVAAGVVFRDGVRVERDVASDTKPNIKKGRTKKTQIEEADAA